MINLNEQNNLLKFTFDFEKLPKDLKKRILFVLIILNLKALQI